MEYQKKSPYKPKILVMLLASLFFAACSAGMAYAAVTNDRGLIINGIITLSESGATVFFWVIAAVSAVFVLGGTWGIIVGLTSDRRLTITENGLRAPKSGYSRQYVTIKFPAIVKVSMQAVNKQQFMTLHHSTGKLSIAQSMLPDKEAFEEVVRIITQKMKIPTG